MSDLRKMTLVQLASAYALGTSHQSRNDAQAVMAELRRREGLYAGLGLAASLALRRIESDIESPTHKTIEGNLARTALAAMEAQ